MTNDDWEDLLRKQGKPAPKDEPEPETVEQESKLGWFERRAATHAEKVEDKTQKILQMRSREEILNDTDKVSTMMEVLLDIRALLMQLRSETKQASAKNSFGHSATAFQTWSK